VQDEVGCGSEDTLAVFYARDIARDMRWGLISLTRLPLQLGLLMRYCRASSPGIRPASLPARGLLLDAGYAVAGAAELNEQDDTDHAEGIGDAIAKLKL